MEIFTEKELKKEFPVTEKYLYFASASTGIIPERSLKAQERFINFYRDSDLFHDPETFRMMARLRANISKLICADPCEIALMTNTSTGINSIASSINWHEGDEILIGDREFPANSYPWLNLRRIGVDVRWIRMDGGELTPDVISNSIGPETRLVTISSVQFSDGYRAELGEIYGICRERGVLLFVDGIQSAGALRDSVHTQCDFFAAGGQKHLLSPYGTGFLYVRCEILDSLTPAYDAWLSHFVSPEDFLDLLKHHLPSAPDARRFEIGTLPYGPLWGMDASIELINAIGIEVIEKHNIALADYFCKCVGDIPEITVRSNRSEQNKSHIVTINVPKAREVRERLRANNIAISLREGGLRFAFHIFNTRGQIDRVTQILESNIRRK